MKSKLTTITAIATFCFTALLPLNSYSNEASSQPVTIISSQEQPKVRADRLFQQGMANYQSGKLEDALNAWQQAGKIYQEIKDIKGEAVTLGALGAIYISLGNYQQAIASSEAFLNIAKTTGDRHSQAQALGNIGIAYKALGNYLQALESHQQALIIVKEIKDKQAQGQILANLANTYEALGKYEEAIASFQESLTIAQETKDKVGENLALGNLGAVNANLGNYQEAISFYEKSLALAQSINDREGAGHSFNNLGVAYHILGDINKAIAYYKQNLEIAIALGDRELEADALGSLAIAYEDLKDYKQAVDYHQKSLAIAQKINDPRAQARALNNLGHTLFAAGNLIEAEKNLRLAIKLLESLRPKLSDNYNISVFDTQVLTYNLLQQILVAANKAEAALEISEQGRARAFVELLATRLSTTKTSQLVNNTALPTLAEIQKIAKTQKATIIEYTIIPEAEFKVQGKQRGKEAELFIWVVKPTGEIAFRRVNLKSENVSLTELVSNARKDIITGRPRRATKPGAKLEKPIKQLYKLLIEPIANYLPTDTNEPVIIIPQESLFLLPFYALQNQADKYLIEQHTILIAPSIQVLDFIDRQRQKVEKKKPELKNVLVVGNPTMPKLPAKPGEAAQELEPLPGAEAEAEEIANILQTKAITGKEATKLDVIQKMPQARLIHLATHGFLDEIKELGVPGAIALAPSNQDNGFLTTAEIFNLKLNAELVVLSACNSGRGTITGDGVIGLSRSFISAGVPSVIASLWKVPDDATKFLMIEFYRQLQQHPDKAQALRKAILATKEEYPQMQAWAGFTLIGESGTGFGGEE